MALLGCFRRILGLLLLLLVLGAAWVFRDDLRAAWRSLRATAAPEEPAPELADAAERKLRALRDGETDRVALSGTELQSLLLYRLAAGFPDFVREPSIALADGRVRLDARVVTRAFGPVPSLGDVAEFLPDTADVQVMGQLIPLDTGRIALAFDQVSAARIPVPRRLIPRLLERAGRQPEPGLPEDAVAIRLPAGASAVYVRGDSLIILGVGAAAGDGGLPAGVPARPAEEAPADPVEGPRGGASARPPAGAPAPGAAIPEG